MNVALTKTREWVARVQLNAKKNQSADWIEQILLRAGFCKCSEFIFTNTLSADSCQPFFYLQPDPQRSFADRAPIARHSVLANVASVALFAATRRRIMNTFFVQKICRTSLLWLDAAEPISANIIGPVWQIASDGGREAAFELEIQKSSAFVVL